MFTFTYGCQIPWLTLENKMKQYPTFTIPALVPNQVLMNDLLVVKAQQQNSFKMRNGRCSNSHIDKRAGNPGSIGGALSN